MKKVPTKKCKECGQQFTPRFTSFQKTCNEPVCIAAHGKKVVEKERAKNWSIEKKERTEKIRSHGEWEMLLEDQIRAIVRLIDADCRCTSCNAVLGGKNQAQAGHRWAVNSYNNLRYDLLGIFIQGVCCNKWKSGNLDGYDEGLLRIYGEDAVRYVKEQQRAMYPMIKMSIPEIKEKIIIAKQIVKELTKIGLSYPPMVRMELRNRFNIRIGIYTKPFKDSEK